MIVGAVSPSPVAQAIASAASPQKPKSTVLKSKPVESKKPMTFQMYEEVATPKKKVSANSNAAISQKKNRVCAN